MSKKIIEKALFIILILEVSYLIYIFLNDNFYISNFIKNLKTDAWTAIGTIFLGFVGLLTFFYDRYKNRKAKVSMLINTAPPDCHQIELTKSSGELVSKCIYIRIRVEHLRGNSAEDIEIIISNFWKIDENNEKTVRKAFLPMNLKWSHYGCKKMRVARGIFRHCDFGSFRPHQFFGDTILLIDTAVQPNKVGDGEIPNIIKPGKYEFELLLSGENSNVIKKRWILEFDKDWSDDENEMLTRHIFIKERKLYNFFLSIFN